MKKMVNTVNLQGVLYEHDLSIKESGPNSKNPGTVFISGTISIATDNYVLNIVPVHFSYVTEMTSKKTPNATFAVLKNILDGVYKTYLEDPASAVTLRVDTAIGLNEFYTDRNGSEELVSAKRNEGGFVHVMNANELNPNENKRAYFKADMLITGCRYIEANEERELPERVVLKGAIFDFRNALLPVEFSVLNPDGMNYFENLNASEKNPIFTTVWGHQVSKTVMRKIETTSAFGDPDVREIPSSHKDYVITGTSELPEQDDESTISFAELTKLMSDRQLYLANVKARQDAYKASKNTVAPAASGGFSF